MVAAPTAQAVVPPPDGGYTNFTTAEGQNALFSLTTGSANTAVGWYSLFRSTAGSFNTGVGAGALASNDAGNNNTATGGGALLFNIGYRNTASGTGALLFNFTGERNAAVGAFALYQNGDGNFNNALGDSALFNNISGDNNTAVGDFALGFNDVSGAGTANANTAVGSLALASNTDGGSNTAVGAGALGNNTTGSGSVAIGDAASANVTTANNVICIGANVVGANVSDTTWIGNVYGTTTQSGTTAQVIVSHTGQLGTVASSERFKKDITTMDEASKVILSLRPVTFHYKSDTKFTPQFGLIAEEVAKVNPALVLPDKEGKPYTVRYDQENAMLLNEFLKEHQTVQELKCAAVKQDTMIASQQKQIEALTAGLQKVSAQLELNKPAPQTVKNTD